MNIETEPYETLIESFHAALVLTGSAEAADRALTEAIARVGDDLSRERLLVETTRSALGQSAVPKRSTPMLPPELQAVCALTPNRRNCFVLRVLMGFSLERCSEILTLSRLEVEECLRTALRELPVAVAAV